MTGRCFWAERSRPFRSFLLGCSVLNVASIPYSPASAAPEPQWTHLWECPAKIQTLQAISYPDPAWAPERKDNGHLVDSRGFSRGQEGHLQAIAPVPKPGGVEHYDFSAYHEQIWFVCRYRVTEVTMTRPLPKYVRECEVITTRLPRDTDRYLARCRSWH